MNQHLVRISKVTAVWFCLAFQSIGCAVFTQAYAQPSDTASATARFLNQYSDALEYYYSIYKKMKDQLDAGGKPIIRGIDILTRKPVVLDAKMIDRINAESANFAKLAKSLKPDNLAPPVPDSMIPRLQNPDDNVRWEAYGEIEKHFQDYESKIERFEVKRLQAERLASEAEGNFRVLMGLEKAIGEINDSPAGIMLNAGTQNRFSWLWADLSTVAFDAIGSRAANAADLLKAYDGALENMQKQLHTYDDLRAWIKLDKATIVLRRISESNNKSTHTDQREPAEQGRRAFDEAQSIHVPSPSERKIYVISQEALDMAKKTREEVKALQERAARENAEQERAQSIAKIFSFIASAASLAGAGISSSSSEAEGGGASADTSTRSSSTTPTPATPTSNGSIPLAPGTEFYYWDFENSAGWRMHFELAKPGGKP